MPTYCYCGRQITKKNPARYCDACGTEYCKHCAEEPDSEGMDCPMGGCPLAPIFLPLYPVANGYDG